MSHQLISRPKTIVDIYYNLFHTHIIYGIDFCGDTSSTKLNKILLLQKKAISMIKKIKLNATVTKKFKALKIMPIYMLFKMHLLLHFMKMRTQLDLAQLAVIHQHNTRIKSTNCLQTLKFNSNEGSCYSLLHRFPIGSY